MNECPRLQSLRLSVPLRRQDSSWVGWIFPRGLCELYVGGPPAVLRFIESPLHDLKHLVTIHEFVQPLLCAAPRLQQFVWGTDTDCNRYDQVSHHPQDLTYAQVRFISRAVWLDGMTAGTPENISAQGFLLPRESIVAFLSEHSDTSKRIPPSATTSASSRTTQRRPLARMPLNLPQTDTPPVSSPRLLIRSLKTR